MSQTEPPIRHEPEARRYVLALEGHEAVVLYNTVEGGLMITETLVPPPLEGRGIAGRLAAHVMDDVERQGLVVLPVCPFFAAWLKKHSERAALVHPAYRASLGV